MTLEEVIEHVKEMAESARYSANTFTEHDLLDENCKKAKEECLESANEHEQLAGWLTDYKRLLEMPKGDCISRSALKKTLCEEYEAREHYIGEKMLEAIDNAPTVDIIPKGEYETACNVLLSLEQIVRSSDGWEESAVETVHNAVQTAIKCMHERQKGGKE